MIVVKFIFSEKAKAIEEISKFCGLLRIYELYKTEQTNLIGKWNSTLASTFADIYALMESGQNFDFEFDFKYASILICEVQQ